MDSKKVNSFIKLAGSEIPADLSKASPAVRRLGAQLLLSEVLEYVIKGLKVIPEIDGVKITKPDGLHYEALNEEPDKLEMLDGLADVAYTMYWNSETFKLPLEEAYELVCDNNLEKFIELDSWKNGEITISQSDWHCGKDIKWPAEVETVSTLKVDEKYYAVGKDKNGKVRKPSSYKSVDLKALL